MKKNFGNDVASAMSKSLFKKASADELFVEDAEEVETGHMHDSSCADDCDTDSNMASDDEDESPVEKKEAAFQMAVDSLLSASAYLEAMAEDRKSDFILKVAAKLVKEKDDKVKAKKMTDKQKADDQKAKEKAAKDKQKAKDQLAKEKEKAAKEKEKEKAAKDKQKAADQKSKEKAKLEAAKDKQKASDKKDKEDDKKSDKKDDKKKSFKDFIKSKKKD